MDDVVETADAPVAEWHAALGGQFEEASHGIVDVGWRRGRVALELHTDTLDARYTATGAHGKGVVGVRVAAAAAGLWITPWTDGAQDPSRAQIATYVGPDGRLERWLGHGLYAAGEGWARLCLFSPLGDATLVVPDQVWTRAGGVAGWWGSAADVELGAGADLTVPLDGGARLAPRASLDAHLRPTGLVVGPIAEGHLRWADNQDDVVATRLGGLTPYNVPLAGASWAELWVQDVAMGRVGAAVRPAGHGDDSDGAPVTLAAFADAAAFTPPDDPTAATPLARTWAAGFGASAKVVSGSWFADASGGVAPGLRPGGAPGWAVYALLGTDWRAVHRR